MLQRLSEAARSVREEIVSSKSFETESSVQIFYALCMYSDRAVIVLQGMARSALSRIVRLTPCKHPGKPLSPGLVPSSYAGRHVHLLCANDVSNAHVCADSTAGVRLHRRGTVPQDPLLYGFETSLYGVHDVRGPGHCSHRRILRGGVRLCIEMSGFHSQG